MINFDVYRVPGESEKLLLVKLPEGKEMVFNTNAKALAEGIEAYNHGALMQDAFPFLSADEREFLISGITPTEWNELFGEE